MKAFHVGMCLAAVCALSNFAEDWAQWRGPKRDGISRETGMLQKWPEGGPKLVWENKDVGQGYGTPAVAKGVVYLISNSDLENEFVAAYSLADGKKAWSSKVGGVGNPNQNPKYPAARSTPTVEGLMLYVFGSDGDVAALETAGGKIKWQKSSRKEWGGTPGTWAYSESPLVDGDAVVVAPGGSNVTMVALNKKSGDLIWKTSVPNAGQAAYASTVVMEVGGVKQYVQSLQNGLIGVDAKSGKFLWRYDRFAKGSPANIPTPVVKGNYVYAAGARTGAALIEVVKAGDEFSAKEVYFDGKLPAAIGGFVLVGNNLFGALNTQFKCVDFMTGEILWEERSNAPASVLFADGNLYLHGEDGSMVLAAADAAGYKENGRFTPAEIPARPNNGKAWAYPVVADGKLLVRDGTSLWCYNVKGADVR